MESTNQALHYLIPILDVFSLHWKFQRHLSVSSELLSLDILLPTRSTPTNITILDDPIYSITYFSTLLSLYI